MELSSSKIEVDVQLKFHLHMQCYTAAHNEYSLERIKLNTISQYTPYLALIENISVSKSCPCFVCAIHLFSALRFIIMVVRSSFCAGFLLLMDIFARVASCMLILLLFYYLWPVLQLQPLCLYRIVRYHAILDRWCSSDIIYDFSSSSLPLSFS